jgi:hypothetical protein
MLRRFTLALLAVLVVSGCGGSSKLSKKSEEKLAGGDAWRAWQLAVRALDREPANPRARAAATAAGTSIVQDWQRRIRALAELDSLRAAEEALKLAEFRVNAAHYATIPVGAQWPVEDRALRQYGARAHYKKGLEAAESNRPKKASTEFTDAGRFITDYKDAAKRADRALGEALTRVAVVPFRSSTGDATFGVEVAQAWHDDLVDNLAPPASRFTRIVGNEAIERSMTISELEGITRDNAIRLGRRFGAQRVVWGTIGPVRSQTKISLFKETIARRVTDRDAQGTETVRWMDVPIEVIARVRDVTVGIDYEVISTESGGSVVRRHVDRSTQARVVWTSYQPEGEPSSYSLVSETVRASNPDRARDIESRWKSVCGAGTTLTQVLEARLSQKRGASRQSTKEAVARFATGAAFVFLEDLPPANDMALSALAHGAGPVTDDLIRLDPVDDVDLDLGGETGMR